MGAHDVLQSIGRDAYFGQSVCPNRFAHFQSAFSNPKF